MLYHVIEHLYEPDKCIKLIKNILKRWNINIRHSNDRYIIIQLFWKKLQTL